MKQDLAWDAGDMGCGELIVRLKLMFRDELGEVWFASATDAALRTDWLDPHGGIDYWTEVWLTPKEALELREVLYAALERFGARPVEGEVPPEPGLRRFVVIPLGLNLLVFAAFITLAVRRFAPYADPLLLPGAGASTTSMTGDSDGGGQVISGGEYTLMTVLGQPDAAAVEASGGGYTLSGGFLQDVLFDDDSGVADWGLY